jgi:hypothetical protein
MKTFHLLIRFCALALLAVAGGPVFANSWVPVSVSNGSAGESDLPGYSQGSVIRDPYGYYWYASWTGDVKGYPGFVPSANVMVGVDPSTGEGYTGSPLYFTGTYYLMGDRGYVALGNIMITVIAPDGSRNVQTLNLYPSYNTSNYYYGCHAYQWTIPITFTTPGTYQAFAALYAIDPYWYLGGNHSGTYGAWYQDINTVSTDGGVTFRNTGEFGQIIDDTSGLVAYYGYSAADVQWSFKFQQDYYMPLTTGNGDQISFTVVTNPDPGHPNQVVTQMIPLPALTKWYRNSNQVSKAFTIQSPAPNNVVPSGGPIYPPNF